ncbi:Uncharacterised protein [Salmonella enterica subsp. enterica serovar Pullorum]|nr:Uncharacterised protein [Salmonella enterica subsp. enterica serovar Pullorum]
MFSRAIFPEAQVTLFKMFNDCIWSHTVTFLFAQ